MKRNHRVVASIDHRIHWFFFWGQFLFLFFFFLWFEVVVVVPQGWVSWSVRLVKGTSSQTIRNRFSARQRLCIMYELYSPIFLTKLYPKSSFLAILPPSLLGLKKIIIPLNSVIFFLRRRRNKVMEPNWGFWYTERLRPQKAHLRVYAFHPFHWFAVKLFPYAVLVIPEKNRRFGSTVSTPNAIPRISIILSCTVIKLNKHQQLVWKIQTGKSYTNIR